MALVALKGRKKGFEIRIELWAEEIENVKQIQ